MSKHAGAGLFTPLKMMIKTTNGDNNYAMAA
jgi:hypothetical protein